MALLEIENLHTYYGHVHALKGISLTVDEGEIVTLIGANGAGKTTTLRTISGLLRPRGGRIVFQGEELNNVPAHEIVYRGISQAPEGRAVFTTLTTNENLNMGAYSLGGDKEAIEKNRRRVFRLFPRLEERKNQIAGTLSGGEQQMLAIGRALMARPKLLMLDEPSLGLAPMLVKAIFQTIREINEQGVTILLVEQNARAALKLADKGYVLETGNIVLEGTAEELMGDERVRKAYLGEQ
ncbi:MAG TPA: ABC transporter ATP-binding protein [Anaerolineae bacterium]|nr:ABC transporter ATP-binding protein [Anaerolineae bacterium]